MALDPGTQFDETSLTAAEFNAQDKVLPNSDVESNDVNAIASRALRRTSYLRASILAERLVTYTFAEEGVGPLFIIGPPNLFNSTTYTDSKVTVDVPGCVVDDDLEVSVWGDWQLNVASPSTVGRARIEIIEDVDGTPTVVPGIVGKASISTVGGTLPYVVAIRHRVTIAGKARVTLQVATQDLTGGAGTATVLLVLSARMDVTHVRRS